MAFLKAPKHRELKPEELKLACDTDCFEFESTGTLKPIEGIVGQERALKALKIGVDLRKQGYNIFITGLSGTGKFTSVKKMLETIRPTRPKLKDYAYVHNFVDADRPALIEFPAGKGVKFKKDLSQAIKFMQENIPQALESEPFVSKKKRLITKFGQQQQKLLGAFEQKLRKEHFTLGQVNEAGMARPEILAVIEDKPVMIAQLNEFIQSKKITQKKAEDITKKYTAYLEELQTIFRKSYKLNLDFQSELSELESETVGQLVTVTFDELKGKYRIKKVRKYLTQVSEHIVQNLGLFKSVNTPGEEKGESPEELTEFEVNIILDNSRVKECPVIIETSPSHNNLFGTIEKYSDGSGGWYSDFTKIKAGSILRANGGYLVLNAIDAYTEPGVWKTLKRVLIYGKLEIQDLSNLYQFSPSILKPEPIEINTKVILIGNNSIYSILSAYENDFNKIFKIKSEFDYEMTRTDQAVKEYAQIVKKLIESEKLLEFDKSAIGKLIEYGARYAGDKNKLTTRFAYIADLVREANYWAEDVGDSIVTSFHVEKAYDMARERLSLSESKLSEMIDTGTILIDTGGVRAGQINGLAVYGNGNYSFGKPTRITAAVSLGNGSIINVEREAGLSGSAHNKGMLIISGYFREKFGRRIPLSFNASIVFEQGYGTIDGDSASITEICSLLSTISNIPIKQSLAITGSVNQKGDIQPIGGVNEKIEGFFEICKLRGLTKKQGVIIPLQNVKDLMLKEELVEAVRNKEFHIFPVSTVEEAAELLTGVKAGKQYPSGRFQANTVFGEVEKQLRLMRQRIKRSKKKGTSKKTSSKQKK